MPAPDSVGRHARRSSRRARASLHQAGCAAARRRLATWRSSRPRHGVVRRAPRSARRSRARFRRACPCLSPVAPRRSSADHRSWPAVRRPQPLRRVRPRARPIPPPPGRCPSAAGSPHPRRDRLRLPVASRPRGRDRFRLPGAVRLCAHDPFRAPAAGRPCGRDRFRLPVAWRHRRPCPSVRPVPARRPQLERCRHPAISRRMRPSRGRCAVSPHRHLRAPAPSAGPRCRAGRLPGAWARTQTQHVPG